VSTPGIIAALKDRKQEAWQAAKAIKETAIAENRDLTPAEESRWQKFTQDIDDANARLEEIAELAERRAVVSKYQMVEPLPEGGNPRSELREMFARGETSHDFDVVRPLQKFQISDTVNSAHLFTSDFADRVATYMRTLSPWMGLATVVPADNGRPLVVPTIGTDTTTYTPGEGTAITESTPALGNATVNLTAYKTLSYVTREALEDVEYDLDDALAFSAARSISLAFGSAATTAVLAGINNGGTASGSPFFGFDDLISLEYSRAAPYRTAPGAAWVASNGAISKIRKLKDSQSQYLWSPSGTAGQPDSLLGAVIHEDPYMAAVASASKSVIFGDIRAMAVVKATPLRVEVSKDFLFDKDIVAFRSVLRAGIAVQDANAAAFLVSASS
jgi:HK97 family phage major capsid protein